MGSPVRFRRGAELAWCSEPGDVAQRRRAAGGGAAREDDAETAATEAEASEDVVGSAGAAAGSSFVAFASGAVIPLLPFFATGATVGVLTGDPLVRRGLRQPAIGEAAALVTYALGRVFGATLG